MHNDETISPVKVGRALGWFSLALGGFELLAADQLARFLGTPRSLNLIRAFGLREVGCGLGILLSKKPTSAWLWARVAGDALDSLALEEAFRAPRTNRGNIALALAVGAGATAIDTWCALQLARREKAAAQLPPTYTPYRDDLEKVAPDEAETHAKILDVMREAEELVRSKTNGRTIRVSHAKAHGVLRGELIVHRDLPPELAQGLFAKSKTYPVVVRISHAPGELTDDSEVSTPRGISIKVFDVEGPKLAPFPDITTQDFVFDTGKEFIAGDPKTFLQTFKATALTAPHLSDKTKGVISDANRLASEGAAAVGMGSAKLDFLGHPKRHPMEEAYYSQTPYRYGRYVAKFGVIPVSPALKALEGQPYDPKTYNAYREATVEFFRTHPAEFDFVVQLNTDPEKMPIEDPTVPWDEKGSPFRVVARLVLPAQDAYDPERKNLVEGDYSFANVHSLAAHRPLGGINRARMVVYRTMAERRRRANGCPVAEPVSADLAPAAV